jgi:hypothetical protein
MDAFTKAYVHLPIDAVDTVLFDPEARLDADRFDRYPTFIAARDAALSSIEMMLDEQDYDGEDHREELERMHGFLDAATIFEELAAHTEYNELVARFEPAHSAAA